MQGDYRMLNVENKMTIGDLIKDKDYDYISYRLTMKDKSESFFQVALNRRVERLFL